MRAGDPITSSIAAVQTVLRKINPSYEWIPYLSPSGETIGNPGAVSMQQSSALSTDRSLLNGPAMPQNPAMGTRPPLTTSPWNIPHPENPDYPETGGSVGSGEDLLDFTQSDMGWDFDFSTMDLEAFFSIYQSNNAPVF